MRNAWGHIFLTADVGIVAVINLKDCWDFSETLLLLRFWHPFTFYLSLLLSRRNTWDISLWFFFFFHIKPQVKLCLPQLAPGVFWTCVNCLCVSLRLARSLVNSLSALFWLPSYALDNQTSDPRKTRPFFTYLLQFQLLLFPPENKCFSNLNPTVSYT